MEENNFKRLMAEEELNNPPPKEIEENIFRNLHIFELLGETVELYLPSAANLFIDMLGGSVDHAALDSSTSHLIGGQSDNDDENKSSSSLDEKD
ncbi:MAG: hypothetical protein P1U70_11290 [Saprospiraceae bacterium]|nr:hypothetical protein [Saprospiraceae bacterium]